MILKSVLSSRDHFDLWDPERHKEPEEEVDHNYILSDKIEHELENPENSTWKWTLVEWEDEPEKVVDDLNTAEDGEASEETHCASYQTQLGLHCHLAIITRMVSL